LQRWRSPDGECSVAASPRSAARWHWSTRSAPSCSLRLFCSTSAPRRRYLIAASIRATGAISYVLTTGATRSGVHAVHQAAVHTAAGAPSQRQSLPVGSSSQASPGKRLRCPRRGVAPQQMCAVQALVHHCIRSRCAYARECERVDDCVPQLDLPFRCLSLHCCFALRLTRRALCHALQPETRVLVTGAAGFIGSHVARYRACRITQSMVVWYTCSHQHAASAQLARHEVATRCDVY
jgi:hypothetical protein